MPEFEWLADRLTGDDDPDLWQVALAYILSEADKRPGVTVEVGRCSHWLRPHQSRWSADGGFAWPTGYGGGSGGHSPLALPQFDWSLILAWTGEDWELAESRSVRPALRVTIPARTSRHLQAAVHALWHEKREKELVFYGFRRKDGSWTCTASRRIA